MYSQIFNVVGPIFIMTFVGYLFGRSTLRIDTATISSMVLLVATPCLVFSTLTSLDAGGDTLLKMALAAALCVATAGLFGLVILRLAGMSYRTILPSLMMPNSGNNRPAAGAACLRRDRPGARCLLLLRHSAAAMHSRRGDFLGPLSAARSCQPARWSISSRWWASWWRPVSRCRRCWPPPPSCLASMMIPAMMILLGTSLARLTVSDLKPAVIIAIAHLAIGLPTALIVIALLSLAGVEAGIVFLLATMPTAVVNYVFAERYRPDARLVAGAVVVSTLLTFILLPAILVAAYWVAGQVP